MIFASSFVPLAAATIFAFSSAETGTS
jgi:hypothetical protein